MRPYDLDTRVPFDLHIDAPPTKVAEHLRDQLAHVPLPGIGKPLRGRVGADGRFELLLNRPTRRNIRPTLTGRIEADGTGSRVIGECALPSWGRWMGRAVALLAVFVGLWATGIFAWSGPPEGVAPALFYAGLVFAPLWMMVVGVVLPGQIVREAVTERAEAPVELEKLLAPLGVRQADVVQAAAKDPVRARSAVAE